MLQFFSDSIILTNLRHF